MAAPPRTLRHRRCFHEPTRDGEAEQARQDPVLFMPGCIARSASVDEAGDHVGANVVKRHMADCAAKGSQDYCFCRKALAKAALLFDVAGNNVVQAHSSAPRSNSAT